MRVSHFLKLLKWGSRGVVGLALLGYGGWFSQPLAAKEVKTGAAHDTIVKPTAKAKGEARRKEAKFSFDFAKAEVFDVVKVISDMTKQNFIIPERIKGQRLTILSPTSITAAEAYQVFYNALAANNITIVKSGNFYKLIESRESIKTTIPTCLDGDPDCSKLEEQMVTTIMYPKYADTGQISGVIKSLISKDGEITIFQPTNAMIISEYAPNLTRIKKIVESLDVPGYDDELQLVKIQYATAAEIAEKLTQIFEVKGGGGAAGSGAKQLMPKMGPSTGNEKTSPVEVQISKIIPDERTNQIIIKANKRNFEAIKAFIAKLDIPLSESEQGKVHVYYLENASAEELASTLSSLAQGQAKKAGGKKASGGGGGAAGGAAPGGDETVNIFEDEIKITADKSTNALIIVCSSHDFRALRTIIEKLDVSRRQVYVEVAILEVTVNNSNEYGLDWHVPSRFSEADIGKGIGGPGSFGFLQSSYTSGGGTSPTIGAYLNSANLLQVAGGSLAGFLGKGRDITISNQAFTFPSFGVLLKWLQTSSVTNVLSTPHILTTDNKEAAIEVGQKMPFRRGTSIPYGGVGNLGALGSLAGGATGTAAASSMASLSSMSSLFSAIERIEISLKLKLKPQINERNKIKMEIDQQLEELSGTDPATQQPITSTRSAKTLVVVEDQQTVVIGGLLRDRTNETENKMPILGDIPLIGWLFKSHTKKTEKVNLLLVLTPYIINSQQDFQSIFERKMQEHQDFTADFYGDYPEYRAHIDYSHKTGPFGALAAKVKRELAKIENGGSGDGSEILIRPSKEAPVKAIPPAGPQTTPPPSAPPPAAPSPAPTPAIPPRPLPPKAQSAPLSQVETSKSEHSAQDPDDEASEGDDEADSGESEEQSQSSNLEPKSSPAISELPKASPVAAIPPVATTTPMAASTPAEPQPAASTTDAPPTEQVLVIQLDPTKETQEVDATSLPAPALGTPQTAETGQSPL